MSQLLLRKQCYPLLTVLVKLKSSSFLWGKYQSLPTCEELMLHTLSNDDTPPIHLCTELYENDKSLCYALHVHEGVLALYEKRNLVRRDITKATATHNSRNEPMILSICQLRLLFVITKKIVLSFIVWKDWPALFCLHSWLTGRNNKHEVKMQHPTPILYVATDWNHAHLCIENKIPKIHCFNVNCVVSFGVRGISIYVQLILYYDSLQVVAFHSRPKKLPSLNDQAWLAHSTLQTCPVVKLKLRRHDLEASCTAFRGVNVLYKGKAWSWTRWWLQEVMELKSSKSDMDSLNSSLKKYWVCSWVKTEWDRSGAIRTGYRQNNGLVVMGASC